MSSPHHSRRYLLAVINCVLFLSTPVLAGDKVEGKRFFELESGGPHYANAHELCAAKAKERHDDKSVDRPYDNLVGERDDGANVWCNLADSNGDENDQHFGSEEWECPPNSERANYGCECEQGFKANAGKCVSGKNQTADTEDIKARQDKSSSNIDERISVAKTELEAACGVTLDYKAKREAEGKSVKGGDSKGIWNAKEHIWLLSRLKAFPDRTLLGQATIVGVKSSNGAIKPTAVIAGIGRDPDFIEVRGSKTIAGELKSSNELTSSIAGGIKKPGPIDCEFRGSSKVGRQQEVEEKIVNEARKAGGKVIVKGRNVMTDQIETIEVDPANYGSEVVPYGEVRPN